MKIPFSLHYADIPVTVRLDSWQLYGQTGGREKDKMKIEEF